MTQSYVAQWDSLWLSHVFTGEMRHIPCMLFFFMFSVVVPYRYQVELFVVFGYGVSFVSILLKQDHDLLINVMSNYLFFFI